MGFESLTNYLSQYNFTNWTYPTQSSPLFDKILLKSVKLTGVNLFNGRFTTDTSYDANALKLKYPNDWQNASVILRVCDDTNGDGMCSDESPQDTLSVAQVAYTMGHVPAKITMDVWANRNMTVASDPQYVAEDAIQSVGSRPDGAGLPAEWGAERRDVRPERDDQVPPIATGWVHGPKIWRSWSGTLTRNAHQHR